MADTVEPEPTTDADLVDDLELSFDAQRYPARPAKLRPRAHRRGAVAAPVVPPPFEPDGRNRAYVDWLVEQSMLADATVISRQLAGNDAMLSNSYAAPDPRAAADRAAVWYTAYPLSQVTAAGESFIAGLGSEELWKAFAEIGIEAIHTGPVKLAGGISGWDRTPSVDGHFDRISMTIDPVFGTEDEFRAMCAAATSFGGTIIDDLVPAHTGKGADFRLAELNHQDYPGIYHMVDIPAEAWHLLPDVAEGADSVNLDAATEQVLTDEGYIIGALQRVIFYEPGIKETNWSVTRPVHGVDGVERRWVYLHYFKDGQPSINWIDPTFAGMRMVMGDAMHSLTDLGTGGLRLDANGFLGVEKRADQAAWSEGHPMSQLANQLMGSMVRKVGGFTFQELNLAVDDIRDTGSTGPDLSYDFITRPAYQLALATGETEFLRLTLREAMKFGIDQASLVHALQNHDELTYELVHFERHGNETFEFGGEQVTGRDLAEQVRQTLRDRITGKAAPYNLKFVENGIASTTTSVVTASLGISDHDAITDDDVERIKSAHLLLASYNAWQPGIFALSGWDLVGALTLPRDKVSALIRDGDTRWINRGAYDLLGARPDATQSASGLPMARALYGSLPEQLDDQNSFARRLSAMLDVRKRHGLATGALLDVPDVSHPAMLVMVNRLAIGAVQVSVFNFSEESISGRVQSSHIPAGRVVNLATRRRLGEVDDLGGFNVNLPAFGALALLVKEPVGESA
ncbi:maltose alpha-D-glucosyltransferase [Aestuariimicrobium ganziense]|uniref:maltose alpha-D-glucosyltransferase n=1 Tax=Aestuariimicrobium ganziense TaxID=2773677 RepID=UPI0019437B54|nr:maltose alpha-D-glucosyltransferase [Aestuariimicrobium ganziense]